MKTPDLIENLKEWIDALKEERHPITLTLNAAIVKLEEIAEIEAATTCVRCGRETRTPERCACCQQEDEIAAAFPHSRNDTQTFSSLTIPQTASLRAATNERIDPT